MKIPVSGAASSASLDTGAAPSGIPTVQQSTLDQQQWARSRTVPNDSVRLTWYSKVMTTIRAEEVRIPRRAREAVARHEQVVVVNRERPAYVIVHPDDRAATHRPARRGRPLREALGLLANAASPDPGFAEDMEAVLDDVGPPPDDPWAPS